MIVKYALYHIAEDNLHFYNLKYINYFGVFFMRLVVEFHVDGKKYCALAPGVRDKLDDSVKRKLSELESEIQNDSLVDLSRLRRAAIQEGGEPGKDLILFRVSEENNELLKKIKQAAANESVSQDVNDFQTTSEILDDTDTDSNVSVSVLQTPPSQAHSGVGNSLPDTLDDDLSTPAPSSLGSSSSGPSLPPVQQSAPSSQITEVKSPRDAAALMEQFRQNCQQTIADVKKQFPNADMTQFEDQMQQIIAQTEAMWAPFKEATNWSEHGYTGQFPQIDSNSAHSSADNLNSPAVDGLSQSPGGSRGPGGSGGFV